MKWDTKSYNEKHGFVSKYGEDVLAWLNVKPGEKILDIGSGTGTLTAKIAEKGADVTGIDSSDEMIAQSRSAYPDIKFFKKDATDFSFEKPFDAVFSNATIHWIKDQRAVFECIFKNLKPGGRLVFEMGGKGNVESIINAVNKAIVEAGFSPDENLLRNNFRSLEEQSKLLEEIGFEITETAFFERPTPLNGEDGMKNWIIQFRQPFFEKLTGDKTEIVIEKAVEELKKTNSTSDGWYADYVRLRIKAIKK